MPAEPIRFDDGAAYERGMGIWSQAVGRIFLDWLAPPPGQTWIDVGCGNGAFTELVLQHCAPVEVQGVDPSAGQISYANTRPGAQRAHFQVGDAMSLPFEPARFDVAAMALVIFFVPNPSGAVSEMIRVVRPGGIIAAYAWDFPGGGFPMEPIQAELRVAGYTPQTPPHAAISGTAALGALWSEMGLDDIRQRAITVSRTFTDFDDLWDACLSIGTMKATFERFPPAELDVFRQRVRSRLPPADANGRLTYSARANAISGRVPKS